MAHGAGRRRTVSAVASYHTEYKNVLFILIRVTEYAGIHVRRSLSLSLCLPNNDYSSLRQARLGRRQCERTRAAVGEEREAFLLLLLPFDLTIGVQLATFEC